MLPKPEWLPLKWAMIMVKLPNLELKEVERIVEALDHHGAALSAAQSEDALEYARLAEMLRRTAQIKAPTSPCYSRGKDPRPGCSAAPSGHSGGRSGS